MTTKYGSSESQTATHEVFNQVPPLWDTNIFTADLPLVTAIHRYGASWAYERLESFGQAMGSREVLLWAEQANRFPPQLKTHDCTGNRVDEVEFHPAYHNLMALSVEYGVHNLPWANPRPGAHLARAALMYMAYQTEAGHCCPLSMTYSVVPALRRQTDLAAYWEPFVCGNGYDGRLVGQADKPGVIFGMGMTEKQGGSDVRANSTRAVPKAQDGPGKEYLLTGHKWFCSAPMSDAFLVLAQARGGLSCYLVPRILKDGSRNNFAIQRLKDKLGNKSNASGEVEFRDTTGFLVGEEGRGVATIIEMVNHTRLDCAIGSAALMRQATVQAIHHGKHRSVFGKRLIEQPLMINVLGDLSLEAEAAELLMLRLAHAYDLATESETQESFRRIASAITKYWLCKRAPMHVSEALECLGGNGYVEESVMSRLFRESPVNSIWEGSGNVICLDVMRAIAKEPDTIDALADELAIANGASKIYDKYAAGVVKTLKGVQDSLGRGDSEVAKVQTAARHVVERTALALQACQMIRYTPAFVANAFIGSRLGSRHGYSFGTLNASARPAVLLDRYAGKSN
ncbi:MAG: acyl-CoA dehydrogenase family protein [Candidatus Obscuribacterales bacterium]|nr:acyl-CoA dehydrogenase family protein [Candidatus Obscuribacterales bacterium]